MIPLRGFKLIKLCPMCFLCYRRPRTDVRLKLTGLHFFNERTNDEDMLCLSVQVFPSWHLSTGPPGALKLPGLSTSADSHLPTHLPLLSTSQPPGLTLLVLSDIESVLLQREARGYLASDLIMVRLFQLAATAERVTVMTSAARKNWVSPRF